MNIGMKIRDTRKAQKVTLKELSEKSGVALASLSRIETSKMVGRIESHMKIAKALNITLAQLYEDDNKNVAFQQATGKTEIFTHQKKSTSEMLTSSGSEKKMMPVLLKIDVEGSSATEQAKPGTEKFVYVLEGKIESSVGSEKHVVTTGDTLYFDASRPHFFKNVGKAEAQCIVVSTS